MSLVAYKKKRKFTETPEPEGAARNSGGSLRFVVQKHHASHLHYDFRLEVDGVLKSWAVPKGPSVNTADKRLAMMVEDHPYDYRTFEGIIPDGNYGAGTVIVWDEGTYEPQGGEGLSAREQQALLRKGLRDGSLKIVLHGTKLQGGYALVRMKGRKSDDDGRQWLLIKEKDAYARAIDVTRKTRSVVSGKTLEELAGAYKKIPTKAAAKKRAVRSKATAPDETSDAAHEVPPAGITPMLAMATDKPFSDDAWVYEIKWDGYRAIATVADGSVDLASRNRISFNETFAPVAAALRQMQCDAVLDGEVVVLDERGRSRFQLLQTWKTSGEGTIAYCVFDVLWLNGKDCTGLTLLERKELLHTILPKSDVVRYSDHVQGGGEAFFRVAVENGLEGIMAKRADSRYHTGMRTREWLKIKTHQRQEAVIAGYTKARGSREHFGALVLGVYEQDELVYIGHTGTGFDRALLNDLWQQLQPLRTERSAFATVPATNSPVVWVRPELVAEVKFQEWTHDGLMRQPVFICLRVDKPAHDVHREPYVQENTMKQVAVGKKAATKKTVTKKAVTKETAGKGREDAGGSPWLPQAEGDATVKVGGHELTFTNLHKPYWKKERITKGDMIRYYHRIAPVMMPYMKDRPQSMNRFPDGADKPGFYQKDVKGKVPEWMATHVDYSESTGENVEYLVCTDEASLLYMANLGCIEMHPWHSRAAHPEHPDYCLIDLDPLNIGFDKVVETALVVKDVLDTWDIPSYCKTSGATGLHIYIPLGAKYTYEQSRLFAQLAMQLVHQQLPAITSMERSPAKRRRKVYLDYLQNSQGKTVAAPYSLRPRRGATASAPLLWEEVKPGLDPSNYTITTIHDRVKDVGDLFLPVLGKGINLTALIRKVAAAAPQGTYASVSSGKP